MLHLNYDLVSVLTKSYVLYGRILKPQHMLKKGEILHSSENQTIKKPYLINLQYH